MDFRVVSCSGLKFECYAGLSPFHRFVAKRPLLSMGTVGFNWGSASARVRESSSYYECKEVA